MRFKTLLFVIGLACAIFAAVWFGKRPTQQIISLDPQGFRAAYLIPATGGDPQVHLIVTSGEMDNQGTEGIPHFAEHLAWLNSVGANTAWQDRDTNAYTTPEQTEYFVASSDPFKAVATLASV